MWAVPGADRADSPLHSARWRPEYAACDRRVRRRHRPRATHSLADLPLRYGASGCTREVTATAEASRHQPSRRGGLFHVKLGRLPPTGPSRRADHTLPCSAAVARRRAPAVAVTPRPAWCWRRTGRPRPGDARGGRPDSPTPPTPTPQRRHRRRSETALPSRRRLLSEPALRRSFPAARPFAVAWAPASSRSPASTGTPSRAEGWAP